MIGFDLRENDMRLVTKIQALIHNNKDSYSRKTTDTNASSIKVSLTLHGADDEMLKIINFKLCGICASKK